MTAPKPPASIKVGPYTYTLTEDSNLNDGDTAGMTVEIKGRITYSSDQAPEQQRSTILHEIDHACAYAAGISDRDRLTQEEFIRRCEGYRLAVLRDNPALVAYLTG